MNHSSALITVAMLSAFISDSKSDYLELLIPFVLTLLPKSKEEYIDKDKILTGLENEYGFNDFPMHVLTKLLNRCVKKNYVYKYKTNYFVKKVYNSDHFNNKKEKINRSINIVIDSITVYLKENTKIKDLHYDYVKNMLLQFFEKFCLDVCKDLKELRTITNKDYNNYHIARFIINESEKSSEVFTNILEIVKGFFVYKAIYYYNTDKKMDVISKLNKTQVYLDTRLLIYALGYNTAEDKKATLELIQLIRDGGGEVRYFHHIKDEVAGILTKFAYDPSSRATMSLAYLDINNYMKEDVIRLRDSLEINLAKLNITVGEIPVRDLAHNEDAERKGFIDIKNLKEELEKNFKNHITNENSNRVDNDVSSIEAISLIRGNDRFLNIEKCKAIFVTQNYSIIETVNNMFKDRFDKGEISFVVHDMDLTALLWLRTFNKNSRMPYFKLLENAYAACAPTDELLYVFMKKVELLEKEGTITDEEALLLRTQRAIQDDLVKITENDSSKISEDVIIQIKNRYADSITREKDEVIKSTNKKIEEYEEAKDLAYKRVNDKANKVSEILGSALNILILLFIVLLFFGCMVAIVISSIILKSDSYIEILFGGIGILISIIGLYDTFIGRKKHVKKLKIRFQKLVFDTVYNNEVEKVKRFYP